MARSVSLTPQVLGKLLDLTKKIDKALQPVELPLDRENDPFWQAAGQEAIKEDHVAIQYRREHSISRPTPSGRSIFSRLGLSHSGFSPSESGNADERRRRWEERVLQRAERKYRERCPAVVKATRTKQKNMPALTQQLSDLLKWHLPALLPEAQSFRMKGIDLRGIVADAVTDSSTASQTRRTLLEFLGSIRLRMERQPAKYGLVDARTRSLYRTAKAGKTDVVELEKTTPAFDRENGKWVKNTAAADLENVTTETLKKYRTEGIKKSGGRLGRDNDGRVWRRPGTPNSHPWYLKSTLRSQRK